MLIYITPSPNLLHVNGILYDNLDLFCHQRTALAWQLIVSDHRTSKQELQLKDILTALYFKRATVLKLPYVPYDFQGKQNTYREKYKPALYILANM